MEFIYKYIGKESIFAKLIIPIFGATLLIFSGKIRIYLPFTPVPITAQTFTLFLFAISLGFQTKILVLFFYFIFMEMFSRLSFFTNPTAGYLIGFFIAGIFVNYFFNKFDCFKKPFNLFLALIFANFFIIHIFGLLGLAFYLKTYDFYELFLIGSAPFITGDVLKILAVIFIYQELFYLRDR